MTMSSKIREKEAAPRSTGKRRKLVVTTFLGSVASLVFAIGYDYLRPKLVTEAIPWLQNHVQLQQYFSSTPLSPQMLVLVLEVLLVCPMVLAVLPFTRQWDKQTKIVHIEVNDPPTHKHSHVVSSGVFRLQGDRQGGRLRWVLRILEGVAWLLWTLAAVVLILGVLYTKMFGVISFSALLAFFAQGIQAVRLLGSHRLDLDEEDDKSVAKQQRPGLSRSKSHTHDTFSSTQPSIRRASSWADMKAHTKEDIQPPAPSPSTRGEKLDVMIFFLVSSCLLLSPYYLHVGLQCVFRACLGCVAGVPPVAEPAIHRFWNITLRATAPKVVAEVERHVPGQLLVVTAFITTILIPLMTHGVGGAYFVGKGWEFFHPFRGGTRHVTTQALGWSLLSVAGILQLLFLMRRDHHADDYSDYLWHGGSWLSMIAHGSLLTSILLFRQEASTQTTEDAKPAAASPPRRPLVWLFVSVLQDLVLTNMHWFFAYWLTSAAVGFDAFSLDPAANLFDIPLTVSLWNMGKLIFIWFLWTFLVPFTPRRKIWKWNVFGKINEWFEIFLYHPKGLFHDSQLRMEEASLDHYHKCATEGHTGRVMYCIMPHGTLPTSVIAVWHQFEHVFEEVCCFFGNQVAIVPGYRYYLAMRGAFMPVKKSEIIRVMKTDQSVSLVPGGVAEMMHCEPHSRQINVSIKHKGFVKLALQHGYDLVPLFFFHSNDQYDNPLKGFQNWSYQLTGIPVGLPWYTNKYRLPVSNRTPIRCVLGKRIRWKESKVPNPSNEQIDEMHRQFYAEVYRVFEKHKDDFGYGDRELTYVS